MAKAVGRAGGGGGGAVPLAEQGSIMGTTVVGMNTVGDLGGSQRAQAGRELKGVVNRAIGASPNNALGANHALAATRAVADAQQSGIRNPIITNTTPSPGVFRTTIRAGRTSATITTRESAVISTVRIGGRAIPGGSRQFLSGQNQIQGNNFRSDFTRRFREAIRTGR